MLNPQLTDEELLEELFMEELDHRLEVFRETRVHVDSRKNDEQVFLWFMEEMGDRWLQRYFRDLYL